jgi:phage terminase large subunit-like protein
MIETCNSWMPGKDSVAEASFNAWVAQEEGRTRGSTKILYDARVAPPGAVLTDSPDKAKGEMGVTEALEFVYDDCWWADLAFIKERIWDLQASSADSRRKYFNQPTADEDAWVTPQDWAKLAAPDEVVAEGESVVLFFDGSKSRDATALMGCRMSDGHVFTVGVWEPDTAHNADDVVDAGAVDSRVIWAHERYDVVAFFADVQEWQGFVKVTWPDRYKDRYVVMAAPAAREPMSIAWDMRSRAYEFAEATETCLEEILQQGFTQDGNAVVARHVGNARRHEYKGRTSVSKESKDSPRKIDAAVCVIGVRMVRRLVLASADWQKRLRRGTHRGRVIVLT